ncbi:amidohydrolase family protein [Pandoraea terrae]|uniref:amidohydrolase family protein n=1 Tax=Pandoraea terrae TaxID=1537710 RepID=UPI00177E9B83|nr:amidohydrolase family protein [Pandoraea terrae]
MALPLAPGVFDLSVHDGRVTEWRAAAGPAQSLWLPPLVERHAHADRAFQANAAMPASLPDAIGLAESMRGISSEDEFYHRAARYFDCALMHGATRVRTHTDVDDLVGERALRGVVAAARDRADKMDVEIVAFANARTDPASSAGRAHLTRALALGAGWLGAVPAFCRSPAKAVDALLDLASETGAPVDLHLDEHGDADASLTAWVAHSARERGLQGRVTISHACALAALPHAERARICEALAESDIAVVVLPATNLFLQGRGEGTPRERGVTIARELLTAGVRVGWGSDNVRDAFFPYGNADPLEAAFLAALAAHVDDVAQLLAGISDHASAPRVGEPANFVLVPADSWRDALARRPGGRLVFRNGVPVTGDAASADLCKT